MVKRENISRWLFLLVMGVLLFPLLQESFSPVTEKPLKGAIVKAKKPTAGLEAWWNGTFQDSFEVWHNENFGLRNSCVRLHNQIEFDLFRHPFAKGVVVGKNNFLYELKYITAYTGKDFIGENSVRDITRKLKTLQDTFAARNITLVVGLAPGKASYYPEYIPDVFLDSIKISNYQAFAKSFSSAGINIIDFNAWFISEKEKTTRPLFPKTGIHWSRYGSIIAADSVIAYVENKRKIDMPSVQLKGFSWSDSLLSPDDDIGQSMNLLFPIKPILMAYPDYNFEFPDEKEKVKMMVIADSYFWNLFDIRLAPRSFSSIDFWYYNQQVYHTDGRPMENSMNADDCLETENNDVIFILASEANLAGIGWGYIDDAYDYFVLKKKDRIMNKMVRYYETSMRMDQVWMMNIKTKAEARKISIDSMIHLDAVYMAEQKLKNKK